MAAKRVRSSGITYPSPPKRRKQGASPEAPDEAPSEDLEVATNGTQTQISGLIRPVHEEEEQDQLDGTLASPSGKQQTRSPNLRPSALAFRRLKLLDTLESLTQSSIDMLSQCSVSELAELSSNIQSDIAVYWSELSGSLQRVARLEGILDQDFQLRSQCLRHIPQKQWPIVRKTLITLAVSVLLRPDIKSLETLHDQMYDIFLGNSVPRAWHFSLFHAVKMQRLRLHMPQPSAEVVNHTLPLDPEDELRVKLGRTSSDRLGPMESIYIEHCKCSRRALLEHGVRHALEQESGIGSRPEASAQLISETLKEEIVPFFTTLSNRDPEISPETAIAALRAFEKVELPSETAQLGSIAQQSIEEDEDLDEEAFLKMARFAASAALQESSTENENTDKAATQGTGGGSTNASGTNGNITSTPSSGPMFPNYVPGMVNANGESIHEQYERARIQATLKAHQSRPGDPNGNAGRRPWSPEEEQALMQGLNHVKGPHWSQILAMYGPNGSISEVLKNRSQVQLKDKARNLKLFFLKNDMDVPPYLKHVTGELQKRTFKKGVREDGSNERSTSEEQAQMDAAALQTLESVAPEITT